LKTGDIEQPVIIEAQQKSASDLQFIKRLAGIKS
jgi:hypothetical protein